MSDTTPSQTDYIFQLAISPVFEEDGLCLAACNAGLRRSTDGGKNWQAVNPLPELASAPAVTCVVFSPDYANDKLILAGTNGALLRSLDGGATWQAIALPTPPPTVSAILFSPDYARDGTIHLATAEDGVLLTTDSGASFGSWNFGLFDHHIFALARGLDETGHDTLFAGTESGVFRSINNGKTWTELAFPLEAAPALHLVWLAGGILLAGAEAHGALRSTDGGRNWQVCPQIPAGSPVNAILPVPEGKIGVLLAVANQVLRSGDGGKSWKALPLKLEEVNEITALAYDREADLILAAVGDEIHAIQSRS